MSVVIIVLLAALVLAAILHDTLKWPWLAHLLTIAGVAVCLRILVASHFGTEPVKEWLMLLGPATVVGFPISWIVAKFLARNRDRAAK